MELFQNGLVHSTYIYLKIMLNKNSVLKMNFPLVSVLITVYNREKYIAAAIESVLAQSMDDFELIIVDDGSTDHSLEIAKQYESDPRVRICPNAQNIGQFPTRNRAASLARGKYLKYVDSDDAIYPHCLEVMTYMMERHPNAGILLCATSELDSFYPIELSSKDAYRRCFIHGKVMSNSPLTSMYKREAFKQVGSFRGDKYPLCSDWDMVLKIARDFSVLIVPTGFCFYRVHHGQIVSSTSDSYLKHFTEGMRISFEALCHPDCPLPENEKKQAIGKILRGAVLYTLSLGIKHKRPIDAIRFLKPFVNRSREILNLLQLKKPDKLLKYNFSTLNINWSDYPRPTPLGSVKKQPENIQVSVVLPVISYKKKDLKNTVESVLVQSMTAFELILCGAKEELELLKNEYSDPRIRILETNPAGLDKNILELMNEGAKAAIAEYVKFLTPGTLMYPWALEHILFPLRKKNAVLAVECAAGHLIYPVALDFQNTCRENFLRGGILVMPPEAACVKRDIFLKLGGFNTALGKAASHDAWLRLSLEGDILLPTTGLTTAYKGWEQPVPQAFMNGILPEHYKNQLCQMLESVKNRLDDSIFREIMKRMNMNADQLAKTERPERIKLSVDWSLYPWSLSRAD